jgi:8-oxo-dGTP pyrophosphatase MutT (NUDIX family)/transcriptional regulator with XRE-family HTH domain
VRVEEVVGRRVRDIRDAKGMTQEQLGLAIGELLGKPWPRQTVSSAEAGRRAFTAVELVALARALGVYVGHLFTPSLDGSAASIELSPGVVLDRDEVMQALFEQMDVAESRGALTLLIRSAENLGTLASGIRGNAQFLLDHMGGLRAVSANNQTAEMQPVVAAIVTSDRGVLIGRRLDGKPPWGFITGEVEPGELPEDAAVREVKEETGLEVRAGRLIGERNPHPSTGRHLIYMAAAPTRGTDVFVGDEAELAEVRWASVAEAVELLPGMFEPVREHLARELGEAGER